MLLDVVSKCLGSMTSQRLNGVADDGHLSCGNCDKRPLPKAPGGSPRTYREESLLLIALLKTLWRLSYQDVHDWLRHLERRPPVSGRACYRACHPERSEGSRSPDAEILRYAQDDRPSLHMSMIGSPVGPSWL